MHVQIVQKCCFFIVKYANLWRSCCRRRRGCLSSLIASLRTEEKRDDAAWRSCCACVFPRLLASWQRRGGQFDLCDRVATCRHYDEYGWESLFKKVPLWVQTASFLFHMGFRRFLQINFLYIHGWLANETSKQLCSGCISPWEQHQERGALFPSSLLPN